MRTHTKLKVFRQPLLRKRATLFVNFRSQLVKPSTVYVLDGIAIMQMVKSSGTSTFGDLSLRYFDIILTILLSPRNCNCFEVHIVFDQYRETSIKFGERASRGALTALKV